MKSTKKYSENSKQSGSKGGCGCSAKSCSENEKSEVSDSKSKK